MRVLHAVANDDQRRFALFARDIHKLFYGLIFHRGNDRRNALMRVTECELVKTFFIDLSDHDAAFFGFCEDLGDRAFSFTALDIQLFHILTAFDQLHDGISAHDDGAVRLLRGLCEVSFFIFHSHFRFFLIFNVARKTSAFPKDKVRLRTHRLLYRYKE